MTVASEADKEQAKLTANYVNGMATSVFALGALSPILAIIIGTTPGLLSREKLLMIATLCLFISFGLHSITRLMLKRGLST